MRDQAILALLSEKSVAKAAAKCGLSERTLHRWLTGDDAFQVEYAAAREATYQSGLHRVQALTAKAIDTLEDLLDAKINPNVRLGGGTDRGGDRASVRSGRLPELSTRHV